jgi:hypothetical protein
MEIPDIQNSNVMSILRCLDSSKERVHRPRPCVTFRNLVVLTVTGCKPPAQPSKLRKTQKFYWTLLKETDLEVNAEKPKHMFMSCHQNAAQNIDMKTANESSENVALFSYLGTTVTRQNGIHEETNRR